MFNAAIYHLHPELCCGKAAKTATPRSVKPKFVQDVKLRAEGAPELRNMEAWLHDASNRSLIGYGFGMNIALRKMTSNIRMDENPLRSLERESWELRSQKSFIHSEKSGVIGQVSTYL